MKYRIKVEPDHSPESPRQWDNIGTMVCWHRRYDLGDEQPKVDPAEYRRGLACGDEFDDVCPHCDCGYALDAEGERTQDSCAHCDGAGIASDDAITAYLAEHFIMLPLFLYDHSGITMRCSAFSCPWDSGQVGFIYAKRNTESLTDTALTKVLTAEVEVYDQYISGDVYGFLVEVAEPYTKTYAAGTTEDDEDWEQEYSCWGFFGNDPVENGMTDHVDNALHDALRKAADDIGEWVEVNAP